MRCVQVIIKILRICITMCKKMENSRFVEGLAGNDLTARCLMANQILHRYDSE